MAKKKRCTKCRKLKSEDEFHNDKSKKDGKRPSCKKCKKEQDKRYNKNNNEKIKEKKKVYYEKMGREKAGKKSMHEDKSSAQYLGIVIGERLCRHLFKDVEVMPNNNTGFDIVCNKGKKIDVKTGCLSKDKYPHWGFHIKRNTIADYFICVAFDNRTDLNPLHMWMIPGSEVNHQGGISIRFSTLHKWNQWERDINDAQLCCTEMKEEK